MKVKLNLGINLKYCKQVGVKNMDVNQELMSKNGLACIKMARIVIGIPLGGRLPTVSELSVENDIPIGTTHNALKTLIKTGAVEVVSRGHMGSYLVNKDVKKLLHLIGVQYLFGAMPLPYTKRFEGLASGLISQMKNSDNIPVNLAYMRGSKTRIEMLTSGRYDFAIVSKMAAKEYLKKHDDIDILIDFGPFSYTKQHMVMFHYYHETEIRDGMRVGIDRSSIDQTILTEKLCGGKNVEFVEVQYLRMFEKIMDGSIDATVMCLGETNKQALNIKCNPFDTDLDSTNAVLIIDSNRKELHVLINELVDKDEILNIQRQVLDGKIQPSY